MHAAPLSGTGIAPASAPEPTSRRRGWRPNGACLTYALGSIEIPISVEDSLSIPAVESKRLQIAAQSLPITIAVRQVKAFGGRLWVFVDAALAPGPEKLQAAR